MHLTLIVPELLWPEPDDRQTFDALQAPGLAWLFARAELTQHARTPFETALCAAFPGAPGLAALRRLGDGHDDARNGHWQRRLGDVLITFESEAEMIAKEFGKGDFEVVYPSLTMQTEFPVAVVEKVVDKKGTRKQATAYLEYLWSKEGQENAAQNYLRPRDAELLKKYAHFFPPVKTFTVDEVFGGAHKAFVTHFKDGGSFDQVYVAK